MTTFDLVIPTIGRSSLNALLTRLDADTGPRPQAIVVVDDRRPGAAPLRTPSVTGVAPTVVRTGGRGPAAARNAGARSCRAPWICFVDDDVLPRQGWLRGLAQDLDAATADTVAVQGQLTVPLPGDRVTLDRERSVQRLEQAAWITADMAVRRSAFDAAGGFDDRFPRAYREDTDLALRLRPMGLLTMGRRTVDHPVRPSTWWSCVVAQRGNADDALMRRLHGRNWRSDGRAPAGRLRQHLMTTAGGGAALVLLSRRPSRRVAPVPAALWAWLSWRFWQERRAGHGAFTTESIGLAATSIAIPPIATWWAAYGTVRAVVLCAGAAGRSSGDTTTADP